MSQLSPKMPSVLCVLTLAVLLAGSGCRTVRPPEVPQAVEVAAPVHVPVHETAPRELSKVILPTYRVEPPDILMIDAIHVVPRSPYHLRALDTLNIYVQALPGPLRTFDRLDIQVQGTLPDAPIAGTFTVEARGLVNLGPPYGSVRVAGMGIGEAKKAIESHLRRHLREPIVLVAPAEITDVPIAGAYTIEPGGQIRFGPPFGSVRVAGMTVDEAKSAIENHLRRYLTEPLASVTLAEMAARQQIAGEHLVAPDGTVTLGSYGSVSVVGHTLAGAKMAIESHLLQFLEDPEVSVDVYAYNSKVYYVITQGAGMGDGVFRFPVTGNETVLDAISQINGLEQVSSKRIWIARPAQLPGKVQVLPVNWHAITAKASRDSNYQVLPGDRIFIAEDKWIALDTSIGKITAPFERLMGFSLLGAGTVTRFSGSVLRGGGNPSGTF